MNAGRHNVWLRDTTLILLAEVEGFRTDWPVHGHCAQTVSLPVGNLV